VIAGGGRRPVFALLLLALAIGADSAHAAEVVAADVAWWVWPLALFVVCFALGIVAVPAGVGGGVLFVPIVSGFFPFHLDFVRGAGLLVALASCAAGLRICAWRCRWRCWRPPVPSPVR